MSAQMKSVVTPKRLPPGRHSSSVMDHTTPKRTAAKRTEEDAKHQAADESNTPETRTGTGNVPPLTFGDERSQEASGRTRTEPAQQGAAHHRRVGVGASIHHWVSGKKIGGLLCDIGTGAAPHDNLDLIHIQVLEIRRREQAFEVFHHTGIQR